MLKQGRYIQGIYYVYIIYSVFVCSNVCQSLFHSHHKRFKGQHSKIEKQNLLLKYQGSLQIISEKCHITQRCSTKSCHFKDLQIIKTKSSDCRVDISKIYKLQKLKFRLQSLPFQRFTCSTTRSTHKIQLCYVQTNCLVYF